MSNFPHKHWNNLKNSWDNKKRLDDWFNSSYLDEAIVAVIVMWIAWIVWTIS